MLQWLTQMTTDETTQASPSAEMEAALAQEAAHALRLVAANLTPTDGAAVLLHEVFELSHAEIAQASGESEANSRQQLRRALLRLLPEPQGASISSRLSTFLNFYLQVLSVCGQ
jgi:RNA polymerase sigma-70 factor (ECF subfamily)